MIVDIHAHYFPKAYVDTLLRIGGRSLPEAARAITARPGPVRFDDPAQIATRLEQMDDAGVSMQVLSPAASPPYAEKEADAVAAARLINDSYAELAQKYPGRFNAVVSLPLPHIDASLREMERGLDQLGMLGVSMTCSCFDRSTAEAEFASTRGWRGRPDRGSNRSSSSRARSANTNRACSPRSSSGSATDAWRR